jgi:serine/threonine protein kinase/tetratricopeptide (TPR) repeat protein
MKSFFPGLSDSIASVIANPRPCPHCDSSSHIAGGLCVGCLLEAGLDPGDEGESEHLADILAEVNLPDQNWRLGNYEVLEEIGRGGMGVIYRARQRHSRRIVALKRVLSYHSDSRETLARFRREAQAAASLDHSNILPIYEVSESQDGLPFFSMKFAPGGTLQQVAPALRNDPRQCIALVAKVARAVEYAHGRGILHRDLKPGNILLDGRGEPLVSDFGLAKWLDTTTDFTRTLTIFGTPGYIAPEQANSPAAELKPTADIYSLGAILFDLLAGRPPFLGTHALSVIRQASESTAPKLRTLSKIADRDLETICVRCLEREPNARYRSAHDLAEDLERWLEGRPIIARPVSPPVKVWRWARRNPKLAIAFAAIIILVGAGFIERMASRELATIVRRAEIARHSIMVAPFEDLDTLSSASDHALSVSSAFHNALEQTSGIYLHSAVGKPEELLAPLSAGDWKKIGEASGARMILTGSVRLRDGKQRVALHLIETASGSIVKTWFEESISFSDSARASVPRIVDALVVAKEESNTSASTERNDGSTNWSSQPSAAAHRYCDQGKELMFRYNLADLDRAIDSFRKAVQIDPNYAEAQALLASACQARAQTDPAAKSLLLEADVAVTTALRIAPMLPEAYRAKAGILRRRGNLRSSLDPFLTAYELEPADQRTLALLGDVHEQIGRPDLALGWFEKALRLQIRPFFADNIGNAWTSLGDYDRAEKAYNTAIIFRPDLPVGLLGLSRIALFRSDYETARDKCSLARAQSKSNPEPAIMAALIEFFSRNFGEAEKLYEQALNLERTGGVDFAGSVRYLSALGYIKNRGHRTEEGRALLEEARLLDEKELLLVPDNLRRLYSLAATHAALGNEAEANRSLEQAMAAGWIDYRSMMIDPRFDSIRNEAAFQEKLTRLTLKVQDMRRLELGRKLASNLN